MLIGLIVIPLLLHKDLMSLIIQQRDCLVAQISVFSPPFISINPYSYLTFGMLAESLYSPALSKISIGPPSSSSITLIVDIFATHQHYSYCCCKQCLNHLKCRCIWRGNTTITLSATACISSTFLHPFHTHFQYGCPSDQNGKDPGS